MNIELNMPGMRQITDLRSLNEMYSGYQLLFSQAPVLYFTGRLVKNGEVICDGTTKINGWGTKEKELALDVGAIEFCLPEGEYKLFFVTQGTLSDRFSQGCTCRLITIAAGNCFIENDMDCKIHGFGE